MPKLNEDLNHRDIYLNIRNRTQMDFFAKRKEIGLDNIESEFTLINFDLPFRIPEFQNLETIIDILLRESTGKIFMEPYQKIRLLVRVFGGQIFYHKIGNGDEWRVIIVF